MAFTKGEIFKMKEAEFQGKVVIPLFRAMKFRDVTPFDGRSLERGKDVVMWKEDDLGERLNYGVLVKAVKVSGKATGLNSASDILNQAQQMLSAEYNDPVTSRKQEIQRCYVISSKSISKEAIHSIESILSKLNLDKVISFIHPDCNLFDLIDKHLPELSIREKLSSVQKELDEATKMIPYKIVASSDAGFAIYPKHEKAFEEMPFEIKTQLSFDKESHEGKSTFEKFRQHFTKGSEVEIEGKFIESFNLPDFLPDLVKPQITEDAKLIFKQNRPNIFFPLRIERILDSGETFNSDRLDFEAVQGGTEEFTFKNDKQKTPLQITLTLTLNATKSNSNFDILYQHIGFNVLEHFRCLRFLMSFSEKGVTNVYKTDSELKIVDSHKSTFLRNENYDKEIKMLEALVLIQQKVTLELILTKENLQDQKKLAIFELAEIIKNGKLEVSLSEIETLVPLERAKKEIKTFENERVSGILISEESNDYEILGNKINAGKSVMWVAAYINKSNFEKTERDIKAKKAEINFRFTPADKLAVIDFLDWECGDRHTRLRISESETPQV